MPRKSIKPIPKTEEIEYTVVEPPPRKRGRTRRGARKVQSAAKIDSLDKPSSDACPDAFKPCSPKTSPPTNVLCVNECKNDVLNRDRLSIADDTPLCRVKVPLEVPQDEELSNPTSVKLVSPAEIEQHYTAIMRLWGLDVRSGSRAHNPAGKPVPFTLSHVDAIQSEPYVCTLKTDGVRYIAYFGKDAHMDNVALFWGLDSVFHEFNCICFAEIHDGTIFDGELTWDHSTTPPSMVYEAFDTIAYCGKNVSNYTYITRLKIARDALDTGYWESEKHEAIRSYMSCEDPSLVEFIALESKIVATHDNCCSLRLSGKISSTPNEIDRLWNSRSNLSYDGVCFRPDNERVPINTARKDFKWKRRTCVTVDVLVKDEIPYVGVGSSLDELQPLDTNVFVFQSSLENIVVRNLTGDNPIVECTIEKSEDVVTLVPIKQRFDKVRPNTFDTVQCSLKVYDITPDFQTLCDLFK